MGKHSRTSTNSSKGDSPRESVSPQLSPRGNSPSKTPRISPRQWKPVMPGYRPPSSHSVVIQRTVEVQHNPSQLLENETSLKDFIPAMPKAIAVSCLLCNVLCPGLGKWELQWTVVIAYSRDASSLIRSQ